MATKSEGTALTDYITVCQAAARIHRKPATIKAKIDAGEIPAIRNGRKGLLVKMVEVESAFLRDVYIPPTPRQRRPRLTAVGRSLVRF